MYRVGRLATWFTLLAMPPLVTIDAGGAKRLEERFELESAERRLLATPQMLEGLQCCSWGEACVTSLINARSAVCRFWKSESERDAKGVSDGCGASPSVASSDTAKGEAPARALHGESGGGLALARLDEGLPEQGLPPSAPSHDCSSFTVM